MHAIVVLGCRPGSRAFARRASAASELYVRNAGARDAVLVACGGRSWGGLVEADELARLVVEGGVPPRQVVRERCSFDTRENAAYAAELLGRRGIVDVVVVTCSWHLPRALGLFRRAGFAAKGIGVVPEAPSRLRSVYWALRERASSWHDARRPMVVRRGADVART